MTELELEILLEAAFSQCDTAFCPLNETQKRILRKTFQALLQGNPQNAGSRHSTVEGESDRNAQETLNADNPLDQLTVEERQVFMEFIQQQEGQSLPWKIKLLNDWLQGRSSGSVQFIRERYGIQWLEQIQPIHFNGYDKIGQNDRLQLKVGDRIEVTNGLWEWVQETGPCSREWFPCTVISMKEVSQKESRDSQEENLGGSLPEDTKKNAASCTIRFDSGAEYEMQGVYDWNRPNWRWIES